MSKGPFWRAHDDQMLEFCWAGDIPIEVIGQFMGRSVSAVAGRAKVLGLKARRIPPPSKRKPVNAGPSRGGQKTVELAAERIPEIETQDDAYVAACNQLGGFRSLSEKAAMVSTAAPGVVASQRPTKHRRVMA